MSVSLSYHTSGESFRTNQVASSTTNGVPLGVWLTGAPVLWTQGIDGAGTVVGVLDTGIDDTHIDLLGKVIGRRDYVQDGARPQDFHYHGTHVAGTVAANGALKGVAPGALLRDYRVLNRQGAGHEAHVVQAIRDAADDGCHVLCMSLGTANDYPGLHDAVKYARDKGCVLVVAVGNEGPGEKSYPAFYPEVIGVGAVYVDGASGIVKWAYFSNTNAEVDVCAHGTDVFSTVPGGRYMTASGTSMATPHVAGFAALKRQLVVMRTTVEPTEDVLWTMVKSSSVDVGDVGIDAQTGAGFVTAYPALPTTRIVSLREKEPQIVVDGIPHKVDVAPQIVNNRILTPTRHTHEPFGDYVDYDSSTQIVSIKRWFVPGIEEGKPRG